MARLHEHYRENVVPELTKKFGYTSAMEVPRITKITVNMGVGESTSDKKILDNAVGDLTKIAGTAVKGSGTLTCAAAIVRTVTKSSDAILIPRAVSADAPRAASA